MRALSIVHQPDAGPGVFAEAMRAGGAELDTWAIADSVEPPADPAGYDAVLSFGGAMHVDQEDEHPWLATEKRLLCRPARSRRPALRRLPGRPAPRRGRRRARAPLDRPRDRLVRGRAHRGGPRGPGHRAARAGLRGLRLAQLRVPAAPERRPPRRQRDMPPGLPHRRPTPGASSSTPRSPPPTRSSGSATTTPTRTPSKPASTPRPSGRKPRPKLAAWNDLGRALTTRFLDSI